ncbi:MAG TPA: hypothetical protein VJB57_07945, partial [Dehalococcoidia bacterium]|nr:hypothetical protein [Dehalococcoidia bacterium]
CWWWTISEPQPFYTSQNLSYIELIPGTWRQTRNQDNDYLIDREMQRSVNFTGLPTNRVQDAAVTESMGTIYDRSHEHLGTSDQAIIFMRRHLIKLAKQLQQGIEPPIMANAALHRVRPINVNTSEPDLQPLWQQDHAAHLQGEALAAPAS